MTQLAPGLAERSSHSGIVLPSPSPQTLGLNRVFILFQALPKLEAWRPGRGRWQAQVFPQGSPLLESWRLSVPALGWLALSLFRRAHLCPPRKGGSMAASAVLNRDGPGEAGSGVGAPRWRSLGAQSEVSYLVTEAVVSL